MRLIDADALVENLDKNSGYDLVCFDIELLGIIKDQPTVEAVPVVHGEWKHRANHGDYLYCDCSVCGYRTENFNAIAEFGKHNTEYIREKWHFCPNCGAMMESKES